MCYQFCLETNIFDCQDVFETKDEIEEVNRKLLEKLLDENEFVAVYFCKFSSDIHNYRILFLPPKHKSLKG